MLPAKSLTENTNKSRSPVENEDCACVCIYNTDKQASEAPGF